MRQLNQRIRRQNQSSHRLRSEFRSGCEEAQDLLLGAKGVHGALCAPAKQRIGNFEVACGIVAARHVAGDFVISFAQKDAWYLALGDLMGKGLAAAMWLTHVLDLLRRSCETQDNLPDAMSMLNGEMHSSRVGVPLTSLFLARLDPNEHLLTYSCGGCPPAFFRTSTQKIAVLERGGPILGALSGATYSAATIDFGLHDTLLVASDGIIEVHHGTDFELRPERVARHLEFSAGESADAIVQSLLARVKASSPVLSDDLSLLAVQRVA